MQESWNSLCLVFLQLWSSLNSSFIWPCRGTARAAKIGVAWQGTFYRFFNEAPTCLHRATCVFVPHAWHYWGCASPQGSHRAAVETHEIRPGLGFAFFPFLVFPTACNVSTVCVLSAHAEVSYRITNRHGFVIGDKPAEAKVLSTKLMLTLPLGQRFDVSVESKREQLCVVSPSHLRSTTVSMLILVTCLDSDWPEHWNAQLLLRCSYLRFHFSPSDCTRSRQRMAARI